MALDLTFINQVGQKDFNEQFFQKLFTLAAQELGLAAKNIELSLSLVKPESIRALNKKYRGKDKVTDVLSFPLEEKLLGKYGIMPLGDIFICFDAAKKDTIAHLAVHGFLHLLGYDHEKSDQGSKEMEELESKIATKFKHLNI